MKENQLFMFLAEAFVLTEERNEKVQVVLSDIIVPKNIKSNFQEILYKTNSSLYKNFGFKSVSSGEIAGNIRGLFTYKKN